MFSKISVNQFSQSQPSRIWQYVISTVYARLRLLFESRTLKSGVVVLSDWFFMLAADDARLRRARMIAEARYGFRWHLAIYIIVNLGLVAIWYYTGAGFPWPIFPILFWGLGVLGHYWGAYHTTGGGWIERETQKILQEDEDRKT